MSIFDFMSFAPKESPGDRASSILRQRLRAVLDLASLHAIRRHLGGYLAGGLHPICEHLVAPPSFYVAVLPRFRLRTPPGHVARLVKPIRSQSRNKGGIIWTSAKGPLTNFAVTDDAVQLQDCAERGQISRHPLVSNRSVRQVSPDGATSPSARSVRQVSPGSTRHVPPSETQAAALHIPETFLSIPELRPPLMRPRLRPSCRVIVQKSTTPLTRSRLPRAIAPATKANISSPEFHPYPWQSNSSA